MKTGDLHTGAARLHLAIKTLKLRWEETKEHWADRTAGAFEENHLAEIEPRVASTLEAVGRLAENFVRAERDCTEAENY